MDTIILTQTEQAQVSELARRMADLSAGELDAAHAAWKQQAAAWGRNQDYVGARRLYMEHMALEQAVQQKLDLAHAWQAFAFQQAFGDLFGRVAMPCDGWFSRGEMQPV